MPTRRKSIASGAGAQGTSGNDDEPVQRRVLRARTAKIMESGGQGVNPQASVQRPSPPKQTRSIPLRCYLCPKQPTFSDISHLLTHISSKSHLACRFKLELQKKSDDDAKLRLEAFEQWYNVNEIEDLLDSRMAAKKEKKPQTKTKAAAIGMKRPLSESTNHDDSHNGNPGAGDQRQPSLHGLDASSGQAYSHLHESRDDLNGADAYSLDTPSGDQDGHFSDSIGRRLRSSRREKETTGPDAFQSDRVLEEPKAKGLKLKGIVYEGMDLFDAATPEQKRVRNQKKDPSVLNEMKATSCSIMHDKLVWDESFEKLTRVRDIYASPSIDGLSDPEDEEVKRKTKKAKTSQLPATRSRQTRSATKAAQRRDGDMASEDNEQDFKPESSSEPDDMNDSSINHDSSGGDTSDDVFQPRDPDVPGYPRHNDELNHHFGPSNRWAMQGRDPNVPLYSSTDENKPPIPIPGYPFSAMEQYIGQSYAPYEAQPSAGGLHQFNNTQGLNITGMNPIFHHSAYGGLPGAYGVAGYAQQGSGLGSFQPITDVSSYSVAMSQVPRSKVHINNKAGADI